MKNDFPVQITIFVVQINTETGARPYIKSNYAFDKMQITQAKSFVPIQ